METDNLLKSLLEKVTMACIGKGPIAGKRSQYVKEEHGYESRPGDLRPSKLGLVKAGSRCLDPQTAALDERSRLAALVSTGKPSPKDREETLLWIGDTVLARSKVLKNRNFDLIGTEDLVRMAELYDELFFDGLCLGLARRDGLSFRWSRRMTSAGGKTTRTIRRSSPLGFRKTHYEIALSSPLLFQTFQADSKEARVCGRICHNRLEAMQRILEHEMIHLIEMLVWIDSNCAANRFQGISHRLFAHTEHRHELVTQRERASKSFNIRLGDVVEFRVDNVRHLGRVNRITRRATVLVEDPKGVLYTDGRRYRKFYVPIASLKRCSS